MVETAMMNSNPSEIEVSLGQFVKINILLWNCKGALNADLKRRIFEMAINRHPSIMVITETRVLGDRAARIIEDMPFDGSIVTDTIGYAGGLWLLWKKDDVNVMLLPRLSKRRILWDNLKIVAQLQNLPWLMLRDFNEVLSGEDKFGGNWVNLNRALQFKECLDDCNMVDLGFAGPKYTWTNRRPISALILERIDRCFANPSWRVLFPEVAEAWIEDKDFQGAVLEFVSKAKHWNYNVFGNLFARKKRVLAIINGAQKALANKPTDFLLNLEKQLIEEYSLILLQEKEYWALKSRLNAATFGDCNTTIFHVSTLVTCHRNKIRCIKDFVGNWITDENKIKKHIKSGFEKLYLTELCMSPLSSSASTFSCCFLSTKICSSIGSVVTDEEVRANLWTLKPFKAPGFDGLHTGFFSISGQKWVALSTQRLRKPSRQG
ncbi:uncharacterized protein LOC126696221 [Quercus robur]|uniref:uncharacterized protein LOC126696221 n=1 Tax=Quercus robur TaxID=38942 RepID=UPI002163C3E9|nr:uncharacterized protein LOC126696221 [Quercus robur]